MTDRGYINESDWTSTRLKREAVYFEKQGLNDSLPTRYELCREPDSDNSKFDTYRYET